MKILFVNHDVSYYGAATSLSLMLRNNPSVEFDMIVPDKAVDDKKQIVDRFNVNKGRLFFFRLDIDWHCYVGCADKRNVSFKQIFDKMYALKDYLKFIFMAKSGQYDLVYINSIVLYPYVTRLAKCVIHIRERYRPNGNPVLKYLNRASGVIFIDEATLVPFSGKLTTNYEIINNPVDMKVLEKLERKSVFEGVDLCGKTVFSIVGQVTEEKGVFEIARAFHKVNAENIILFIAGNCSKDKIKEIQRISQNDKRIIILGHCDSVHKLYIITDYVIRGERHQCVGRTILEGLFAGCFVLAPGDGFWREFKSSLEDYKDNVLFYPPGEFSFLEDLIRRRSNIKVSSRMYASNVENHVVKLNNFLKSITTPDVL